MGILNIARGRETDDDTTVDSDMGDDTDLDDTAETGGDESAGGRSRRWLVVLGLVAVVVAAYVLSRRRATRDAEFTEIELEPTESDTESASME